MCLIEPSAVVETRRLVLRAPGSQDVARLAAFANDPAIARMTLRMPHPYGVADAEEFVLKVALAAEHWSLDCHYCSSSPRSTE